MSSDRHLPGEVAPRPGRYEELNASGAPTGTVIEITGGYFPPLPRGSTWRLVKRLLISEMSTAQLTAKAAEYRRMATTATTVETREALLRIAMRFSVMAQERVNRRGQASADRHT